VAHQHRGQLGVAEYPQFAAQVRALDAADTQRVVVPLR